MHFNETDLHCLDRKNIKGYDIYLFFFFLYSAVLCTSQVFEVIKNAENDIFSLVSSNLMSIFTPNKGHKEKIIPKS